MKPRTSAKHPALTMLRTHLLLQRRFYGHKPNQGYTSATKNEGIGEDVGVLPVNVLIPKGAKLLEIQESYGPLAENVRCGLEGCRTPHKKGFVVSYAESDSLESKVGIVGNVCGKREFGTEWTVAEKAFDAKLRAAEMIAAKERFLARMEKILPHLKAAMPRLEKLAGARKTLSKYAPEVMRLAKEAVKSHHGRIKRREGQEDVTVHRLKGDAFWADGGDALFRSRVLSTEVTRFLDYIASPEATTKEVERHLANFVDIEHRWKQFLSSLEAAEAALRPSHLTKLLEAVSAVMAHMPPIPGYENILYRDLSLQVRMTGSVLETRERDQRTNKTTWRQAVDLA